jgi:hypothetical protein
VTFGRGNASYDAQTIVAATPDGDVRDQVRRPNDVMNVNVRVEQALGAGNALRAEYQRRTQDRRNLGVGDFDLAERSWASDATTDTLRLRNTRLFGKKVFSELKFEFVQTTSENTRRRPARRCACSMRFTGGGAGQTGVREGQQFVIDQSVDFTLRKHALRAGVLFEAGQWDSTQQTNANGTYTFSSRRLQPASPARSRAASAIRSSSYSQYQLGWAVQDDFRLSKNLQASLGCARKCRPTSTTNSTWRRAP